MNLGCGGLDVSLQPAPDATAPLPVQHRLRRTYAVLTRFDKVSNRDIELLDGAAIPLDERWHALSCVVRGDVCE